MALILVGFAVLGTGVWLTLRLKPDASKNRAIASEVAGYLGVALALGGAMILFAQYWEQLGVAGRILVPLGGTAVAYVTALLLGRSKSVSARRLSQTLFGIGIVAAGVTGAMVARPITESIFGVFRPVGATEPQIDYGSAWTLLAGTLTATVAGAVTWWFRKGSITEVAFVGALASNVLAAMSFTAGDAMQNVILAAGGALLLLGTVWTVLGALERVTPVRTALVMGSGVALFGLQMLLRTGGPQLNVWAALLGIAYGIAGIVASIYLKRGTLLGFGAVYIILFTMMLLIDRLGTTGGAPLAMLGMGVVFIVVATMSAKLAPRVRRSEKAARPPKTPRFHKSPIAHA